MRGIGAGLGIAAIAVLSFGGLSSSAFEKGKEEMKQEKEKETSIKDDLLFLILKILIFIALLAVTFLFIFGICRVSDNMMSPAFKDGDLAVYYRLRKNSSLRYGGTGKRRRSSGTKDSCSCRR